MKRLLMTIAGAAMVLAVFVGKPQEAIALPDDISCGATDDSNNGDFGGSFVAGIQEIPSLSALSNTCNTNLSLVFNYDRIGIIGVNELFIINNVNNDDDGFTAGISVSAGANVSNLLRDGAPYTSGTQIPLTTADAFTGTFRFDFGGISYEFSLSKTAGSNELSGFAIQNADSTPPTVAITGVPDTTNGAFEATFQFSEDVTGFDTVSDDPMATDIIATNATVSAITAVDGDTYRATITPTNTGPVTVQVPAGAATDGTNLSLASGTSTSQFTTPQDVAQQQIGEYVAARHGLIMANRPSTQRRLSRFSETGIAGGESISAFGISVANPARFALAFEGNEMSFAMRSDRIAPVFSAISAGDGMDTVDEYANDTRITFWTEGRITLFDDDATDDGRFGIVHAGVDYLVNERVLLGFSAQVDWLSQDNAANGGGLNGVGWLAGPTLTLQVQDNFYVDLAAALGQSYNDINPLGTYTDEFTTNRLFLSGGLIGDFEVGLLTIQPSLSFSYIVEEQEAYTDSNAALVAAQTLSQGEVRFGPRIARTFALVGGDQLSTFISFDGVYTFGDAGDYADGTLAADIIGFTGATELGATWATRHGLALTVAGNYGGIGSDASLYGGRVNLRVPLN